MKFWICKSEPDVYSIDHLKKDKKTLWTAVRNYQARNFLLEMNVGDEVFIYHSNVEVPGIVGIAKVTKKAAPDPEQFDSKSEYFDPKATKEKPRWFSPELTFKEKFKSVISLDDLRSIKELSTLQILKRGNRLSVTPVSLGERETILHLK